MNNYLNKTKLLKLEILKENENKEKHIRTYKEPKVNAASAKDTNREVILK